MNDNNTVLLLVTYVDTNKMDVGKININFYFNIRFMK
jgi:hypothetical protein